MVIACTYKLNPSLVFVWHTESCRMKYVRQGHKQYYAIRIQVVFTYDGQTLITGGHQDGKVIFWDVASGEELATLPGTTMRKCWRSRPMAHSCSWGRADDSRYGMCTRGRR
jgi:WD40 repeat protein